MKALHLIAALSVTASLGAGAAAADGVRIAVGDLAQPAGAVAFDHRLADAANKFCFARFRPNDLVAIATCRTAIRAEAMDQLSPAQRDAFARSRRAGPSLASADR